MFIGVKMLVIDVVHVSVPVSLGIIAAILAIAVGASLRAQTPELAHREGELVITLRMAKRVGDPVAGGALLGAGVVMMVTPGPGLLVIAAGLAVLATEFAWAERQRDLVACAKHERERLTGRPRALTGRRG